MYCVYAIYFAGGFIFTNFASWVLFENLTTRKIFTSNQARTHECDCVRNTSSTVHSAHAREDRYFCLLKMSDCSLLDRKFNYSRKCLEVPIREKLDSRNIWRIQYTNLSW